MKTTKLYLTFYYILIGIILNSCVKVDDFSTPELDFEEPDVFANSNIIAVKNVYEQSGESIYTYSNNDNSIIEGFVISSDEAGNFYKTIVIQDNYEDPTSGVEIMIDLRSISTKFNFGRKIYLKMAGLSVTNNEGKYKIGYNLKNKLKEIPQTLIDDYIIRSTETKSIIPQSITLAELSQERLNTYVQIKGLQFRNDEIGKTFSGEKFDKFNGDRVLLQCDNQLITTLSTSGFSRFKSIIIPDKKGMISAVLTKDYYAEKYVLVLNNLSDIDFTDENRCDPYFLNCNPSKTNGLKLIFFENFQEIKKTKDLEVLGWTNVNAYLGNGKFKKRTSKGNVSMQISAYGSEENPLEAWLVTPEINLDGYTDEVLTFETKATYDNGSVLTAWVSTDFDGNIGDATWLQLDVKISVGPGNSYVNKFISSGEISLNCLEGNVFIALKYSGGDPGISTTYDIDNLKIVGN